VAILGDQSYNFSSFAAKKTYGLGFETTFNSHFQRVPL